MPGHEDNGGGWGVLAGAGVALTQLFVLLPGLFAIVALTTVFLIPFALPLIPIGILAGAFVAIRAVWRALLRLAGNETAASSSPSADISGGRRSPSGCAEAGSPSRPAPRRRLTS